MASFLYFSMAFDAVRGLIDFDTDTFRAMIVTSSYTPSQAHSKRSDITNEVSGTGYTAGGPTITVTPSQSTNVVSLTFSSPILAAPVSGFTGRRFIIYKSRGGAASADELVACIDPGSNVAANGTSYTLSMTGPLTLTTPVGT